MEVAKGRFPHPEWKLQCLVNHYLTVDFLCRVGIIQTTGNQKLVDAVTVQRRRLTDATLNSGLISYDCKLK